MPACTPPQVAIDWDVPAERWGAALAECPGATYFHTAGWLEVVARSFGTRIERARFSFGDGRWGLLPLSIRPLARGLVPLAVAGETGAYSGLVSPVPLTGSEAAAAYAAVRARHGAVRVTGSPFAHGAHLPPLGEGWRTQAEATHVLALKPLSELRAAMSRGCKARGNKARKLGLVCVVSSDPAMADVFYPLYADSMRRWGEKLTWARPLAFFQAMLAAGPDQAAMFVALRGGEPVSALLFAHQGRVAHYVAGATREDQLDACPSNFLMEEALAHYHAAGCTWFDFGPSNGLEGVMRFKESFGATPAPFVSAAHDTPAARAYFAVRHALGGWRASRPARDASATTARPAA